MEMKSLIDMYIAELQELVSVEEQLEQYLARAGSLVAHTPLREALHHLLGQAQAQKTRLVRILDELDADPRKHEDQAMEGLVAEANKMFAQLGLAGLRDVAIIASTQKLLHYQMAAYGTAAAIADQLGRAEDSKLLHKNLDEERDGDNRLTDLALLDVNEDAKASKSS